VYHLKGDSTTTNEDEANEKFIEREFGSLLDCDQVPHDPIFVPDIYLYQEMTNKVTILEHILNNQGMLSLLSVFLC
jgi:hypothetical protein